ncbi:MAG: thioredoxin [Lachnospiraceae bacterium]|jgi:thioredoxin|nr:thioredoxin [Lachnospiraceae bacterium]MCI8826360.1 thioredoxin [Lachnospiraceae bacterium]MCI9368858.1 thioredoxin [Lachnospiraceae bacterium]
MSALHVTENNFKEEVLNAKLPVLVDFWSPTCGPCLRIAPVIEELSKEVSEVKFAKVNVGEEQNLAEEYGIMSIPTLVLIKNGKEEKRTVGAIPKEMILEFIK